MSTEKYKITSQLLDYDNGLPEKPFLINCVFLGDNGEDHALFSQTIDGLIHPYLDGYTIIPNDKFNEMKAELAEYVKNDKYSLKA